MEQLMLETDAPYMGFPTCRQSYLDKNMEILGAALNSKQRKRLITGTYPNVPSSLPKVLDQVVELLDGAYTREEVARHTTENAISFFGFNV
jgi:Tat protein secretion system quality control protein TatD with DNase activity